MKEPHHKQPYQTGFYFFWKWQYFLRHEYVKFDEYNKNFVDFEEYLINYNEDVKYKKTSDQILEEYINGSLKLENLLIFSPKWFRRGYNVVDIQYKNSTLHLNIDTQEIDMKRQKKSILNEIEGVLDMIEEEQKDEGIVPERPVSIGHEKYWRRATSKEVKNLKLSFMSRAIGLWLWEHALTSDRELETLTTEFNYKFSKVRGSEKHEDEQMARQIDIELDRDLDIYRKYLDQTKKSIENIDLLPL